MAKAEERLVTAENYQKYISTNFHSHYNNGRAGEGVGWLTQLNGVHGKISLYSSTVSTDY